ncbi:4-hydroxy-3-methylbut-2-enyl diphosphate reductase [Streptomyces chartreusis]|uniref:4-hydroxy-3-methylbut-2-enyl diphosphate reductase n=1 Tax=Streptomyces chartreusis TaxID=1969 RepID=UPI0038045F44
MGTVLLAAPRGFCAGVDRAIETVEQALLRWGPPVYVRNQIVHNTHVVRELASRGAVFVSTLENVPEGSTVVFSAHGVAPAVYAQAEARRLNIVDATCPLVAKVHQEVRRYARHGYEIALVGHAGHEEIEGTRGEAQDRVQVVGSPEEAARLEVQDESKVVWLSQTTLAVDDVADTVRSLRARLPLLQDPPGDDICYASQNRQDAIRAIAEKCDLLLVIGSANSSNSARLAEVALRAGAGAAYLIDDASYLEDGWFAGVETIGVTAGASAPESRVGELVTDLATRGYDHVEQVETTEERIHFSLPRKLDPKRLTPGAVEQVPDPDGQTSPSASAAPLRVEEGPDG